MTNQGKDEACDQSHVVIQGQPAVNTVLGGKLQRRSQMVDLAEHGGVRQRDSLLQAGRACRMLNESDFVGVNRSIPGCSRGGCTDGRRAHQARIVSQADVLRQFLGKLLVNNDEPGLQIGRRPGQSEPVFGGLDLEIGISRASPEWPPVAWRRQMLP